MKIQITPNRIIKDPEIKVVWGEETSDSELIMNPRDLGFKQNSLETIYAFHFLEHFFIDDVPEIIKNLKNKLIKGGKLFIVVDNFEHISRMFVGSEITISEVNKNFTHPSQYTKDNLAEILRGVGFNNEKIVLWNVSPDENMFKKEDYELIIAVENE